MKKDIIYIVTIIVLSLLLSKSCNKEPETITIKEEKIVFQKPDTIVEIQKEIEYKYRFLDREIIIEKEIDSLLLKEYEKLVIEKEFDKQHEMFIDAVKIREYSNVFEDDKVKLTIYNKTQGKLLDVQPEIVLKERTIELPSKNKLPLYLGGGLNFNTELSKTNLQFGGAVEINKQLIYTTYSLDKTISVGTFVRF